MFQHVLVPLDGSFRAEQSIPVAERIARATGGSLLLVRVIQPPIDYSGGLAPMMTGQIVESEMADARDYLQGVAAWKELAGIDVTTEVLFGFPGQQLMEAARTHECDLIALCSHGRTGLTRWALGSVAHTLVHQSTVPVLVLRQEEASTHTLMTRVWCTLVPLDGSQLAEEALAPAVALTTALARPGQGVIHMIQVVQNAQEKEKEGEIFPLIDDEYRLARSYLATISERVGSQATGDTLTVTFSVEYASDVASALLGVAEQAGPGGCDVIAISTHGRDSFERLVMGSVTQRLLETSRLPMLIVRPHHKS